MLEVRTLDLGDAEAYWRIRLEALDGEPLAFGTAAEEHRADGFAAVTSRHLRDVPNGGFAMGAFKGGELVGIVGFLRSDRVKERHSGGVVAMYVTSDARGKGVARALLVALINRVRGYEGLERVGLSVTTHAPAARALYLSLGFEPFGVEVHALKVDGRYADMEHMVLNLPRHE